MAKRRAAKRRSATGPRKKNGQFKKYLTPAQRRASKAKSRARLKVFKGNIHKGWAHTRKALRKHSRSGG